LFREVKRGIKKSRPARRKFYKLAQGAGLLLGYGTQIAPNFFASSLWSKGH